MVERILYMLSMYSTGPQESETIQKQQQAPVTESLQAAVSVSALLLIHLF